MNSSFGSYIRTVRKNFAETDRNFTLSSVARRVGIQPSYLSKIERSIEPPPSEKTISDLAKILVQNPDVLLAMAGKISSDLKQIITKRPELFAELIRGLRSLPTDAIARVVREVRAGEW